METRAAVCEYDAKRDHLTLTIGASYVRETVQSNLFNEQSKELTLTLSRRFNHINFQ